MWKNLKVSLPAGWIAADNTSASGRCVALAITMHCIHYHQVPLAGRRANRTVGAIEEASPDMTVALVTVGFRYSYPPLR